MKRMLLWMIVCLWATSAGASDLTIPTDFVGGTTASAAEVNANFDAVETAVDDNDSRIDEILSDIGLQPIYYVEDYGTGLTGINAALAACDAAADATASLPGIVMLPRGGTTITVTGSNSSPLIQLPEATNGSDDNRYASCELRGWGMVPQQAFANPSAGSFLYFYNPDAMVADGDGRKVLIQFGAYGQILSDFGVGISGDSTTDYDGTTMIYACSTERGAYAACEYGLKSWEINRVSVGSASTTGVSVGLEMIFALNGAIRDSWFTNLRVGYLPTTMAGTASNANDISHNRFAGNDDAILIDGALACQDMYITGNTIEGNVNGVHLTDDATCHVTMLGNHFEQDSAGTQAGARDVWLEGTGGSVTIIGGYMAGDITDANHIVFAQAQGSTVPTHVVQGVRFAEEGVANFTAAANTRLIFNEDFSRASPTVPTASAGDNDTSPASTAFAKALVDTKSAASSTDNTLPRFDSTAGDLQTSGVSIDDSNNMTVPGNITTGTSGASCLMFRDTDVAGYTECFWLNGVQSCTIDADGTCDGA